MLNNLDMLIFVRDGNFLFPLDFGSKEMGLQLWEGL